MRYSDLWRGVVFTEAKILAPENTNPRQSALCGGIVFAERN